MYFKTFDDLYNRFSNYYIHEKGKAKFDRIVDKVHNSKHTRRLLDLSARDKFLPNESDFATIINSNAYFMFAGGETTATAEIILMSLWNFRVNKVYNICADHQLLEKGYRAFNRWKVNF